MVGLRAHALKRSWLWAFLREMVVVFLQLVACWQVRMSKELNALREGKAKVQASQNQNGFQFQNGIFWCHIRQPIWRSVAFGKFLFKKWVSDLSFQKWVDGHSENMWPPTDEFSVFIKYAIILRKAGSGRFQNGSKQSYRPVRNWFALNETLKFIGNNDQALKNEYEMLKALRMWVELQICVMSQMMKN